jgi:hypothetical protein
MGARWGGKELLNLIGKTIYSEGEERLLAYANLDCLTMVLILISRALFYKNLTALNVNH